MTGAEIRGFLTGATLLWLCLLVLACLDTRIPAFGVIQAVRFHLTAAGLILVLLLLVFGAKWRALAAVVVVVATLAQAGWLLLEQQNRRWAFEPRDGSAPELTVVSFNVLANSEQGQNVVDYLLGSSADIIAVMETPGILLAMDRLAAAYPYHIGCELEPSCDLSLWSRLPLINPQMHPFGPSARERLISGAVIKDGHLINVVALHLSKPYYDGASTAELWQVSHLIADVRGPLLVTGDFNAPPWTSEIVRFARRNQLAAPSGYPGTWPVRLGDFGLPIDTMFTRGGLIIEKLDAIKENYGSNHRGIIASATLRAQ